MRLANQMGKWIFVVSILAFALVALGKEPGRSTTGAGSPPPKWWLPVHPWAIRMCFLFDQSVDPTIANEKVRRMTESYATCGIQLVSYTFTVKSTYPNDPKAVGEAAQVACPLLSMFGVRGAIQVETKYADMPQKMCMDPGAKGCSTLCSPLSISLLTPNAGAAVGLHESMHSNCCGPYCVDTGSGRGIPAGAGTEIAAVDRNEQGDVKIFHAGNAVAANDLKITPAGCRGLRAGASRNDIQGWYQPPQNVYYSYDPDPTAHFDLMAGKSFFRDRVPLARPETESKVVLLPSAPPTKGASRLLATVKQTPNEPDLEVVERAQVIPAGIKVGGMTPADLAPSGAAWPDPRIIEQPDSNAPVVEQPVWRRWRKDNAYMSRDRQHPSPGGNQ